MRSRIVSFWRTALYRSQPKVIGLSLLPPVFMAALTLAFGNLYWEEALELARTWLEGWSLVRALHSWMEDLGWVGMWAILVPMPLAIWLYTLALAFSALWFAHFLRAALLKQRGEVQVDDGAGSLLAEQILNPALLAMRPITAQASGLSPT